MPPQNLWAARLEKIPSVGISSIIHNPFEWRHRSPAARYIYIPAEVIVSITELNHLDLLEIASLLLAPFSALMSGSLWIYQSLSSVSCIFWALFMATFKLRDQ